jgi:hypothetical protein
MSSLLPAVNALARELQNLSAFPAVVPVVKVCVTCSPTETVAVPVELASRRFSTVAVRLASAVIEDRLRVLAIMTPIELHDSKYPLVI